MKLFHFFFKYNNFQAPFLEEWLVIYAPFINKASEKSFL